MTGPLLDQTFGALVRPGVNLGGRGGPPASLLAETKPATIADMIITKEGTGTDTNKNI